MAAFLSTDPLRRLDTSLSLPDLAAELIHTDAPRSHDKHQARPLPAEPTDALPGTPEKVACMEGRVQAHRQPHHPLDARPESAPELAYLPSEERPVNGLGARACLGGGRGPLADRAQTTTGHHAGSEVELRARLDAQRRKGGEG